MRHVHPKLHYSNIKGEFRKLKYLNTVHFPHTLVLTSWQVFIQKNLCKSSPPELLLTWALCSWRSDSAQDWPPSSFRSPLKFLLMCLLLFVWFRLVKRWNLLMPQPWSQTDTTCRPRRGSPATHTHKSVEIKWRCTGKEQDTDHLIGSMNKKQILKKSHRKGILEMAKDTDWIPLILSLSDLKLLLPKHVGMHFTNPDFQY